LYQVAAFFMNIILLGALQGFIVSGLLFWGKKNRTANRLLSKLIFLMALASLNLYMNYIDWFHNGWLRLIFGDLLPLVVVMPMGPLIWFYTRAMMDASFTMTRGSRRHFYPVIIDLVPCLTAWIYVVGALSGLLKRHPQPWGLFIDTYNVYADIPRWISMTWYIWMAHRLLKTTKDNQAPAANMKWLRQFIQVFLVFQGIWFLYLVPYVIPKYTDLMLNTFDWYPIYVPLAIMIYWLGIKGFIVSYQAEAVAKKAAVASVALSADVIERSIALLKKSMEEDALFLNPNCNLSLLAQHTGLAQKTISSVLNQHLNKSFNEYVNEYRVGAFKKKILQPGQEHLTITGIAFDCGFNSQATFQRTFKEFTGMSPTEFRKTAAEAQG
jgi:AraC-like DNA-binding protein